MKVKICGVARPEDARAAARLGADFVGAILSPGFPRSVTAAHASTYLEPHPPLDGEGGEEGGEGPVLVGVMVDPSVDEAIRWGVRAGVGVIQLHGEEPPELLAALRKEGSWSLWKAARVASAEDVVRAVERYGPVADGLLLDGAREGARGGGHGVRFPWEVAEEARAVLGGLHLVAAGGLTPDNVGEVVRRLAPDVVDVSSGVEVSRGVKDGALVERFVRNARAAAGS